MQLAEHTWQLLAGYVEQRGIGKNTVESAEREIELEKILMQDFATTVRSCHLRKTCRALKPYWPMAAIDKGLEVPSRPTAEIENGKRCHGFDVAEQRFDVLGDIVIARSFPEVQGALVVMFKCARRDFFEILRSEFHISKIKSPVDRQDER